MKIILVAVLLLIHQVTATQRTFDPDTRKYKSCADEFFLRYFPHYALPNVPLFNPPKLPEPIRTTLPAPSFKRPVAERKTFLQTIGKAISPFVGEAMMLFRELCALFYDYILKRLWCIVAYWMGIQLQSSQLKEARKDQWLIFHFSILLTVYHYLVSYFAGERGLYLPIMMVLAYVSFKLYLRYVYEPTK